MHKRFWKPKKVDEGYDWRPVEGVTKHHVFGNTCKVSSDGTYQPRCNTRYINVDPISKEETKMVCTNFKSPDDYHSRCSTCVQMTYSLQEKCDGQVSFCPECSCWGSEHPGLKMLIKARKTAE